MVSFLNQDMDNARKCEQEEFLSLEQHIEDLMQEKICIAVKSKGYGRIQCVAKHRAGWGLQQPGMDIVVFHNDNCISVL